MPQGEHSGTQPGSASTGWTGATGGAYTGLTPQAAAPGAPDRRPEVVTGLDPRVEPLQAPC